jgi:hypothetical protein
MSPEEFNSLPLGEKSIQLWDKGKFTELWENEIYKVGIYQMNGRIVSVCYDDNDKNEIISIRMWNDVSTRKDILERLVLN